MELIQFYNARLSRKFKKFSNYSKRNRLTTNKNANKTFILKREKEQVLDSLPEKTEMTLLCNLTPEQEQLYQTILNAAKQEISDQLLELDNLEGSKVDIKTLQSLLI